MTNPEIPEGAVTAAAKAFHEHDKHDPWDDEGCNDNGGGEYPSCKEWTLEGARAMLAAALPHLRVQETASGECLARRVLGVTPHVCLLAPGHEGDHQWTADREATRLPEMVGGSGQQPRSDATYPQDEPLTPHPRPVVDREAVAVVLRSHYRQHGPGIVSGKPFEARCSCRAEYGHGKFFEHLADAVLALLPTEEGEGS